MGKEPTMNESKPASIENEKTKKISNELLLADIDITRKEMRAYGMLTEGFEMLASLPENQGNGQSNMHYFQASKYRQAMADCDKFLNTLLELKKERGLS